MRGARSDIGLWQRAANESDTEAFLELFDRFAPTVIGYLFQRTGDWLEAMKMAIVAFVETWNERRQLSGASPLPLPTLFGAATRVLRQRTHQDRRHKTLVTSIPIPDDPTGPKAEAGAARQMREVVGALPTRAQDAVWLRLQGMNEQETADALRTKVGKVRTLLQGTSLPVNGLPIAAMDLPDQMSLAPVRAALERQLSSDPR